MTKTSIELGGVPVGMAASPIYKKLNPNAKYKVEELGLNWSEVKYQFGSSGTTEDNTLLLNALNSGWVPGQPVPEKFRTKTTKSIYLSLSNLNNLIDEYEGPLE
jgi:hypothetical protein